ncbi:uncharacterized protein LOC133527998 [Cydia pomonella]|uniref:uncharacterized protein LOC133527998 n=1 Tax=Cydia pomonella TaxID=82600 RepID=UPI002ADE283B|nr:uncharacterized protein LOC133527998 [Cydia pomonella]
MCKIQVLLACLVVCSVQAAVLDPALYLSPSPPLTGEPRALTLWSGVQAESTESVPAEEQHSESGELEEPQARTFWSSQPPYGVRGIHIPLTFSLTGTYGTNAAPTGIIGSSYRTGISGVIGSGYASVSEDLPFGKSGLAGSSYGLYRSGPGTRIYGGSGGAAWSGWGNGKWGHYGKG